jgi:hypothetical protein
MNQEEEIEKDIPQQKISDFFTTNKDSDFMQEYENNISIPLSISQTYEFI